MTLKRLLVLPLVLFSAVMALACTEDSPGETPSSTRTATAVVTLTPAGTATLPGGALPTTTPAPGQTPSPTPTTAPGAIPQSFRDFARQVNTALASGDIAFFRSRAVTKPVVCTADNTPPRDFGQPDCRTIGERFDGFPASAWRSEGSVIPIERAMETLARLSTEDIPGASDKYGSSAPVVYAIGTGPTVDSESYSTLATALIERPANFGGSGPLRVAILLLWEDGAEGGSFDFRLLSMLHAFVLAEDFLDRDPVTHGWMPVYERFTP